MSYYPDPPAQTYWPDEPYRYWADYHGTDYWPEAPSNGYEKEEPVKATAEESERDTSIWTAPVLAPPVAAVPPAPQPKAQAPQQKAQVHQKPALHLVPPASSMRAQAAPTAGQKALSDMASVVDRKVLLIDAKQSLKMLLKADDSDGYTRAELEKYLKELEETLGDVRKSIRGNLLHRVTRFLRPDQP